MFKHVSEAVADGGLFWRHIVGRHTLKDLLIGFGQLDAELITPVYLGSIKVVIAAPQFADAMLCDVVESRAFNVVIQHMLIVVELHSLAGDGAVPHAVCNMLGLEVVRIQLQHLSVVGLDEQLIPN